MKGQFEKSNLDKVGKLEKENILLLDFTSI